MSQSNQNNSMTNRNTKANAVRNIFVQQIQVCMHAHKASLAEFKTACLRHCPLLLKSFGIEQLYNGTVHARKVILTKASYLAGHSGAIYESEIKSKIIPESYKGDRKIHQDLEPVSLNTIARLTMIPRLKDQMDADLLNKGSGRFVLPTGDRFKNIVILFEFSDDGHMVTTVVTRTDHEKINPRDLLVTGEKLFSMVF